MHPEIEFFAVRDAVFGNGGRIVFYKTRRTQHTDGASLVGRDLQLSRKRTPAFSAHKYFHSHDDAPLKEQTSLFFYNTKKGRGQNFRKY